MTSDGVLAVRRRQITVLAAPAERGVDDVRHEVVRRRSSEAEHAHESLDLGVDVRLDAKYREDGRVVLCVERAGRLVELEQAEVTDALEHDDACEART